MNTSRTAFVTALVACLFVAETEAAAPLLGAGYGNSGVYRFDLVTGAASVIPGSGDIDHGLGYDSSTGTLYGLQSNNLYRVDANTGALSFVALASRNITALDYNPLDGKMYTLGQAGELSTVKTTTGVVTLIGSAAPDFIVALAINGLGQAYAAGVASGDLWSVDLTTGAYSSISTSAFAPEIGMRALAFDELGKLYGVGTISNSLGIIDTTTGAFAPLGGANGVDNEVRDLEFIVDKRAVVAVPEP